jgi:hypothetical protein
MGNGRDFIHHSWHTYNDTFESEGSRMNMWEKKRYMSKMLWVNIIAVFALLVQAKVGREVISPELQTGILAGIDIVLRSITNESLTL